MPNHIGYAQDAQPELMGMNGGRPAQNLQQQAQRQTQGMNPSIRGPSYPGDAPRYMEGRGPSAPPAPGMTMMSQNDGLAYGSSHSAMSGSMSSSSSSSSSMGQGNVMPTYARRGYPGADAQPGLQGMEGGPVHTSYMELAAPAGHQQGQQNVGISTRGPSYPRNESIDRSIYGSTRGPLHAPQSQHGGLAYGSSHSAMSGSMPSSSSSSSSSRASQSAIPTFGPHGWRAKLPTDDAVTRLPNQRRGPMAVESESEESEDEYENPVFVPPRRPMMEAEPPRLRDMNEQITLPSPAVSGPQPPLVPSDSESSYESESDEAPEQAISEGGLRMRYSSKVAGETTGSPKKERSKSSRDQSLQNGTSAYKISNPASASKVISSSIEDEESLKRLAAMNEWKERRIRNRSSEIISRVVFKTWRQNRFRRFLCGVRRLQATCKRFISRRQYLALVSATIFVQRRIRAKNAARWLKNATVLVRVVERAWRRFCARRTLHWLISTSQVGITGRRGQRNRAAARIQARFRFRVAVREFTKLIAARHIQRQVRQWIHRRILHEIEARRKIVKCYRTFVGNRHNLFGREISILEATRRAQAALGKAMSIKSDMQAQFLSFKFFFVIISGLLLMTINSFFISSRIATDSEITSRFRLIDSAYISKLRGGMNYWVSPQSMDALYPKTFPRTVLQHLDARYHPDTQWDKNVGECALKTRDLSGRISEEAFTCLQTLPNEWFPSLVSILPDPRKEVAATLCPDSPPAESASKSYFRRLFLLDKDAGILPSWRAFRNLNAYQMISLVGLLVTAAGFGASVYIKPKAPIVEQVSIGQTKRLFMESLFEVGTITRYAMQGGLFSFILTSLLGISSMRLVYFWVSESLSDSRCESKWPFPPLFTILTRLFESRIVYRATMDKSMLPIELNEVFITVSLTAVLVFLYIEVKRYRKNCLLLQEKFFAQIDKLTMDCYGFTTKPPTKVQKSNIII